ncbi:GyrI-like domain-containing protein [Leptospira sp. 'Mane']|uniref:GyrI-like domain-containing protein n=1 Tax=Leptospira sp. 'Mane' TaxID=3387407 RepID=UPI00398B4B16
MSDYQKENINEKQIIGISAVTKNADEMNGKGKIPELWQRFFEEGILDRIPDKKSPYRIIVVYTDFESDETGNYRILIGAEVETAKNIPSGFTKATIPNGNYVKHTTEVGSFATIGIGTWQKIWVNGELRKQRNYISDFEIYDERANDPDSAQFDIYVGVK